jgi:hypothetical protein
VEFGEQLQSSGVRPACPRDGIDKAFERDALTQNDIYDRTLPSSAIHETVLMRWASRPLK